MIVVKIIMVTTILTVANTDLTHTVSQAGSVLNGPHAQTRLILPTPYEVGSTVESSILIKNH